MTSLWSAPKVHEIYLERVAERDLNKLEHADLDRIIAQMKALAENPRPAGCRKIRGATNDWRIHSGIYRIIYEIDEKEKTVKIYRIRHRKEAYR
ncbi:MAG: plasmid stabilization protein [Syntrophus sp. (in: bacteria)]|nr:plasmid stabilization protein [Syntrophus sp. (in: bacteria)]